MGLVIGLACFWVYVSYRSYVAGNTQMAVIYIVIGVAVTSWRVARLRRRNEAANAPREPTS